MLQDSSGRLQAIRCLRRAFAIAVVGILPIKQVLGSAQNPVTPDPSAWSCATCPFDYGWTGTGSIGLDALTNGNYRFGEYSGYNHKGIYLTADGQAAYRDENGYFFDAAAGNLGLGSRWIDLQGGRQGLFELHGLFREIPQFLYDSGRSPYLGFGGTHQTLPANWVYGGTTAQMTAVPNTLQPVSIRDRRSTLDLGAGFTPKASDWDFLLDFRHDLQTGSSVSGASFLTTSTQLVEPVDYRTDQIDASMGYSRDRWQIRAAYYGSFFNDGNASLEWMNPYTQTFPGMAQGRSSFAPSNAFNQLSVSGGWQVLRSTRIMASLAYGREIQDSAFIPTTINPTLNVGPLPVGSLNGLVGVGNYLVRVTSTPLRHLSLTAEYVIDRRDNKTAQNVYQQVSTDTFVAASQTNRPYSFDRQDGKLTAAYRIVQQLKIQAGGSLEHYDRSFESALRTHTKSIWGEANSTPVSGLDLSIKYSHARRDFDSYEPVAQVSPADNPLLRQFDLANRIRDQWRSTVAYAPSPNVGIDLTLQQDTDQYSDSSIGLTSDKDYGATLNANWKPVDKVSSDIYLSREYIKSEQASSQSFSVSDWSGTNYVVVSTLGIDGQWHDAIPGLDVGTSVNYSYSRESVVVATGTAEAPFPNNSVNSLSAKLWSRYHINTQCTVHIEYAYERLDTSDWALDGVEPNTIPNVLSLGLISPRYQVSVVGIRIQYAF